jgi:hypothetical protein
MAAVTYRQLDSVLRALGFAVQEPDPEARVYEHPGGALLIFPTLPANDPVREHHLVATRMTLEAFGIADPPEFTSRLQKVG